MSSGGHRANQPTLKTAGAKKLVLVGPPNVGKSVLFNRLTGVYVTVSNYPGTTVEVSRGRGSVGALQIEVIDTPGMYSLSGISEEERVGRRLLIKERPDLVAHVVDAKALEGMLSLTMELIEAGWPVILVVNLLDEAAKLGLEVDLLALERELGIPVVGTAAVKNAGLEELKALVALCLQAPGEKGVCCPAV